MLQIQDDKVWQASKLIYNFFQIDDYKRRLDHDHLDQFQKENILPRYPHRIADDGEMEYYNCGQSCCDVDPGRFCCCSTTKPDSSFQKLGMGLCLYFKFLKHSFILFLIIGILTISVCLTCYLVATQNDFNPISDYQTFLFSTTLGTFSSEHMKCQYIKIPSPVAAVTFSLSCPYGRVNYYGPTYSSETLNTLYNCKNEIRSYQSGSTMAMTGFTPSCTSDGSSCTITFTPTSPPSSSITIAYSYECLDQKYKLKDYSFKSQYLLYGVVGLDLFCCIILTLFFLSESKAEDQEIKYFKQEQVSLNDFSIKFNGLNLGTIEEEFNQIVQTLKSQVGKDVIYDMVQVKIPDRIDFVEFQNKKKQAYQNLYQFISQEFFDLEVNPSSFSSSQNFIENNFSDGKYQKYKQKFVKLLSEYHYLQFDPTQQSIDKNCSIFLIFNSFKIKKKILQLQQRSCFSKFYRVNDKKYKISQPPAPDSIIWQNKGKWTFLRSVISWILTLLICFGSYMLFGYIQSKQIQYLSTYNFSINCDVLYTSLQMSVYNPPANDNNYLPCFCKSNLLNFSYSQCTDWRTTYFTYLSIPIIISFFLVVYNIIVSSFFRALSKFQSHRLIGEELASFTIKRSFMLIMNMALIMIILNMKYSSGTDMNQVSFLLQGRYNDFTPDWYLGIGTVIILTMIFNISFPIIELLMATFLKCLKNCWDRKCCTKKTSCKTKAEYMQLFSNDIYPIQERYACLISMFLITLAFSCIIPILNLICGISLMLLYFSDRVLVFKIYQTPANYGSELHKVINQVIYYGLIAHFALTAFFLSEPQLIAPNSYIAADYQINLNNTRINNMISLSYIIPYIVLCALFIVWPIFSNTFIALCKKCCKCICSSDLEEENISKYKSDQTFFDSLSLYQICRLQIVTESEINKLAAKNSFRQNTTNNSYSLNETIKELTLNQLNKSLEPVSEHEVILRRTANKLQAWQTLRKREKNEGVQLIGLPSYQIMISDEAAQQDKKNNELSQSIKNLLGGV